MMKCPSCKLVKRTANFCGECGTRLEQFEGADGVWKPEGLWQITTYSDEEGRRPATELGVYEGHIVDLAKRFSGVASYSLTFTPAESMEFIKRQEPRSSVDVQLSSDANTNSMKPEQRIQYFRNMLKGRVDVEIGESIQYACVRFHFRGGKK